MSRPPERGPRLHEGWFRHRGAGWEAIRSHLGRTCPRYEGDGTVSFLHALRLSATESGFLSVFSVKFLTRKACHLCDEARPIVEWAAARTGATVEEVDIEAEDRLVGLYGLRIPVVLTGGGEVLAEGTITNRRKLAKSMRRASKA